MPNSKLLPIKGYKHSFGILCLSVVIASCGNKESTNFQQVDVPNLETVVISQTSTRNEQAFDGVIEAANHAIISSQAAGRIIALPVDVNSVVKTGDILVRLEDNSPKAQFAQADAMIAGLQARVMNADKVYARTKELFDQKLIAPIQMDSATAERDASHAQLRAAQSARAQVSQQLNDTVVRAPFNGVVTTKNVSIGESVGVGSALLTLQGNGHLRAVVDVPQAIAEAVKQQPRAKVQLGNSDFVDASKVIVFSAADLITHTFKIRADLPSSLLKQASAGMLTKVVFQVGSSNTIHVPQSALVWRGEVSGIYVLHPKLTDVANTPNKAPINPLEFRIVRVAHINDSSFNNRETNTDTIKTNHQVEVLSGLNDGDHVVIDAQAASIAMQNLTANPDSSVEEK